MNENNLADKISELLNDPEGMSRIEEMAEKLLGGQKSGEERADNIDLSGIDIGRVLSAFRGAEPDDRSRLLLALRPHLSPARRDRVDKAVKLLRLISVMPFLKESVLLR